MLDSGILRLRPVLITVAATVIALFPLVYRGGPLWEPMCYTRIGGLLLATVITKVLVSVLYAILVIDLKILKWESKHPALRSLPMTAAELMGPLPGVWPPCRRCRDSSSAQRR